MFGDWARSSATEASDPETKVVTILSRLMCAFKCGRGMNALQGPWRKQRWVMTWITWLKQDFHAQVGQWTAIPTRRGIYLRSWIYATGSGMREPEGSRAKEHNQQPQLKPVVEEEQTTERSPTIEETRSAGDAPVQTLHFVHDFFLAWQVRTQYVCI